MSAKIILQVILFGLALSMDAFAVSITDGLIYKDISKKKSLFIAIDFGLMQAIMPLIGYWFVVLIETIAGQAGKTAGEITSKVVTWIAFILLLFVGTKMLIEGIIETRKPDEKKTLKNFSIKEVLFFGLMTSIDALAVGISFKSGNISNNQTIFLHVSIVLAITFIMSFIGTQLGGLINKLLKGKYEVSCIVGGAILIALAIWTIVSHYCGL